MENMSLIDAIIVGTPEVLLTCLIGIILIKGNIFKSKEFSLRFVIKTLLVSIVFPLVLIIIRKNIDSFIIMSIISLLYYILILKVVFRLNVRQALLGGYLAVFALIFYETFSTPIINLLKIKYSGNLFQYRFIFSFPTRIFQIITVFICLKFNLKSNKLLTLPWNLLSKSKKITFHVIVALLLSGYLFSMNYNEIFFKIYLYDIDARKIFINIQIFLIETIVFMIVTMVLLSRTILYENYKEILNSPQSTFQTLLYNSTEDEIYYYLNLMKTYLNVIEIEKIEEILKSMKESNKNFYYHIDERLGFVDYDFKKLYFMLEILLYSALRKISFENVIVTLELREYISFNLKIILNDLEKRRLIKILEHDLNMENIKLSLIGENARYRIIKDRYFALDIQIPYKEVTKDEKA
ncbi:hypothetical protein [Paramaledivibacter caminithermalis]|uniref:Uncharacterized protein n=1 Tax=Paramaledivibacter caminithermalis (strain DSM 15212 / CIP 107654 / DViRD3) TaxID=1121301 RepID=A0A1M6LDM6_PARC5|nr:hypothetical protein [Paramaledivibacter caminithermalis]SHJ69257.1 hypothetical protein SAMN02745912_00743 [Paramaledivibacter caminithermalis DSM 15212]